MKKAASVFLRAEITREDIENIIDWLENEAVTQYLEDGLDTVDMLRGMTEYVPEHFYTMMLNDNGMFYIIDGTIDEDEEPIPVGFLRLDEYEHNRYELVFAVGREDMWGNGLGKAAVRDALSIAFFELRADNVRALVRRENIRSARVLTGSGFLPDCSGDRHMEYSLTLKDYLKHLQKLQAM